MKVLEYDIFFLAFPCLLLLWEVRGGLVWEWNVAVLPMFF